jgi:hypothetical protein
MAAGEEGEVLYRLKGINYFMTTSMLHLGLDIVLHGLLQVLWWLTGLQSVCFLYLSLKTRCGIQPMPV